MTQSGLPTPAVETVGEAGPLFRVIERLAGLQRPDGGWPYAPGQGASFTEPTCWTLLALHTAGVLDEPARKAGVDYLRSVRTRDGGFHCGAANAEANWATGLVVFTLAALDVCPEAVGRGLDWLLTFEGRYWPNEDPRIMGHDTQLRGWPWVAETHSWAEPTFIALYALGLTGRGTHARAAEAVRMIRDRALPSGGWNYGNTYVLGNELRAFPSTTAMGLIALEPFGAGPEVDTGLAFLKDAFNRLRTPWALGWAVLAGRHYGLDRLGTDETGAQERIETCLGDQLNRADRMRVHEVALLTLAARSKDQLPFPTG